jgi:hypothetical protein
MWKRFINEGKIVVSTLVKCPTLLRYKKSGVYIALLGSNPRA